MRIVSKSVASECNGGLYLPETDMTSVGGEGKPNGDKALSGMY